MFNPEAKPLLRVAESLYIRGMPTPAKTREAWNLVYKRAKALERHETETYGIVSDEAHRVLALAERMLFAPATDFDHDLDEDLDEGKWITDGDGRLHFSPHRDDVGDDDADDPDAPAAPAPLVVVPPSRPLPRPCHPHAGTPQYKQQQQADRKHKEDGLQLKSTRKALGVRGVVPEVDGQTGAPVGRPRHGTRDASRAAGDPLGA